MAVEGSPFEFQIMNPCIICGNPRHEQRLTCNRDECLAAARAMPIEEIHAIREREVIEAFRRAPADGAGVYVHFLERIPGSS